MSIMEGAIPLNDLVEGKHERCAYCYKPFSVNDEGKFNRLHAYDGKWYCNSACASAFYLKRGWTDC